MGTNLVYKSYNQSRYGGRGYREHVECVVSNDHSYSKAQPKVFNPVTWLLVVIFLINFISEKQQVTNNSILDEIIYLYLKVKKKEQKRNCQPFSKQMMMFCMTLAGYSKKAYISLRKTFEKLLPSASTLTRYRNRIDGSPGFSTPALNMIKSKVEEKRNEGKQLYLSLSCESIQSHTWFNG